MKEGPISRESMEIKIIQSFTKVPAKSTKCPSSSGKNGGLTANSVKTIFKTFYHKATRRYHQSRYSGRVEKRTNINEKVESILKCGNKRSLQ